MENTGQEKKRSKNRTLTERLADALEADVEMIAAAERFKAKQAAFYEKQKAEAIAILKSVGKRFYDASQFDTSTKIGELIQEIEGEKTWSWANIEPWIDMEPAPTDENMVPINDIGMEGKEGQE